MADDRSLDEFLGTEESPEPSEAEPAAESSRGEPAEAELTGEDADTEVEPMAETFSWSAAGGDCATCGESVEERWRDDDALVCGDCKAW